MNRLQQLRIDERMTVPQLADRIGVSSKTIYNLEAGKGASLDTLSKLADVFEVKPSSLLRPAFDDTDVAA